MREITRLIDEQINSVRRELANMLNVGVIVSDSADNKLYYEINQHYEYYSPLKAIFADETSKPAKKAKTKDSPEWSSSVSKLAGIRLAVAAGALVRGSASPVDLLLVGSMTGSKVKTLVKNIEKLEGKDINYAVMPYDDFYYRLSVRDRFIMEIISGKNSVLVDTDGILKKGE